MWGKPGILCVLIRAARVPVLFLIALSACTSAVTEDRETDIRSAEFPLHHRYLNFPVRNGAEQKRLKVFVDGEIIDEFDIELASFEPDFWVFLDLLPHQGKTARVESGELGDGHEGLGLIELSDDIRGTADLYREKFRPQFHFSSRRGWNNDPNGLVFYDGEYHLYYQHNPYGWKWGNMHWGHAVSKDLVHWVELPIAIYPRSYGDWAFSGSAVVDERDTAGFQDRTEKTIVAALTSTGRGEIIAYSNDRGRTFTEYPGNPVVRHEGRDPKVFWYRPGGHWVMAVYDQRGESRGIAFYSSSDLKDWAFQSRIDGYYECPEIFELAVDGDEDRKKWVVYGGDGDYSIGNFDGKVFTAESGKHRFNYGNSFYASQTFNNLPAEDDRRIQISWGRIGHPSMPFNQMMNFPVELTLRTTSDGVRMFARPVREIEVLHRETHRFEEVVLEEGTNLLEGVEGVLFHIRAEFGVGEADEFGLRIRGIPVTYEVKEETLRCVHGSKDGESEGEAVAHLQPSGGQIRLEILVDRTSMEIFANDGQIYMPVGVIPEDGNESVETISNGGETKIVSLELHELDSIWQPM